MANFNRVILMGNVVADPVVRYVGSGTAVCDLRLAINRYWNDKATNTKKEETTFIDVTLWGRDAEVAGEYASKGKPIMVEGRLRQETWDDKATGQKRSKITVVGEMIQLLGSSGAGGGRPGGQGAAQGGGRRQQAPSSGGNDYSGGSQEFDDSSSYGGGSSGGSPVSGGGSAPPDDDVPF